jgi:hypothetical protein
MTTGPVTPLLLEELLEEEEVLLEELDALLLDAPLLLEELDALLLAELVWPEEDVTLLPPPTPAWLPPAPAPVVRGLELHDAPRIRAPTPRVVASHRRAASREVRVRPKNTFILSLCPLSVPSGLLGG